MRHGLTAIVVLATSAAHAQTGDELFESALALTDVVTTRGCGPHLVDSSAHPFREAPAACDVFLSLALASMAVDAPARTPAARAAIERLYGHVRAQPQQAIFRSSGNVSFERQRLPRSVLYRGYALLVGAALERLGGRAEGVELLAGSLARDLEGGWLPSFGRSIWPCDHAPAAAGLILMGQLRREPGWERAGRGLVDRLSARLDPQFPARIDARGRAVEPLPRGTVLAFTAGFLQHADIDSARLFANALAEGFCDRLGGLAACREWPRGVDRRADAVSGPIVGGYGTGATALGGGATRVLADRSLHEGLLASAEQLGIERIRADRARFGLENAIDLWSRSARFLGTP
ncbi:MAG: hypothetical protein IT378_24840 [Sandaracinaceae bacterium]|nr:hypothetical protein [Sandaracinaceae bacterium]